MYVFCEKDAISGTLAPVTQKYDVPLCPVRGYVSDSFAHAIGSEWAEIEKPIHAYYLGDHDASGRDLERSPRAASPASRTSLADDVLRHVSLNTLHGSTGQSLAESNADVHATLSAGLSALLEQTSAPHQQGERLTDARGDARGECPQRAGDGNAV